MGIDHPDADFYGAYQCIYPAGHHDVPCKYPFPTHVLRCSVVQTVRQFISLPTRNIVIGQKVSPSKIQRAKELRHRMTPEETMLWEHLRANRLQGFHFRRQQVIAGYIVDFYCHSVGLVVEVNGGVHDQRVEYDLERSRALGELGLRILLFKNQEIREDIEGILVCVIAACQAFPPI